MQRILLVVPVAALALCGVWAQESAPTEVPADLGLREEAEARLAQFEVSVTAPPEALLSLTRDDLTVKIGLKSLESFRIDPLCGIPEGLPEEAVAEVTRPSFLLYFDQPHLTQSGRARALQLAREMIPLLVAARGRITVVSNADEIATYTDLSGDAGELLAALDRLENDRAQWDPYASFEASRVDEILRALNSAENLSQATSVARRHQRYERWLTERNLRRLEMVLGRLAHLRPPKAVIYFADTLRSNPGEHYVQIFSRAAVQDSVSLSAMETDALTGRIPFDRVIRQASANGIRFYPVHAQGLVQQTGFERLAQEGTARGGDTYSLPTTRIRHAQDSQASLATETGGAVFLHGAKAGKIADRILSDLSCILLVSFDPAGFSEDVPLRLKVVSRHPDVKIHSRGQIVIQSESALTTARLMGAFAAPGARTAGTVLGTGLVPIDREAGKFRVLLQIHAPGAPVPGATWDLGASVVQDNRVLEEISGRLSVPRPGVPVILEKEVALPPGRIEIVAVAHESTTNRVTSSRTEREWTAPGRDSGALSPVALLQPSPGIFLRDGKVRTRGSLALDPDRTVRGDRPIALVGIACRGKGFDKPLRVERRLMGRGETAMPALELEPDGEPCMQFRDVIRPGSLAPGVIRYEVRLLQEDSEIDATAREFVVEEP